MSENMKKFLEAVSENNELFKKASAAGMDELIAMGKDLGIYLTAEDFKKPAEELSDVELDAVAGGSDVSCVCPLGGGTKDDNAKTCACVLAGAGYSNTGRERCVYGFAGYGYDT